MALLELDQSAFTRANRLDMHALLESWLPGYKVPRREDYLVSKTVFQCQIAIPSLILSFLSLIGWRAMGTPKLL
jgi:hypothetical protein